MSQFDSNDITQDEDTIRSKVSNSRLAIPTDSMMDITAKEIDNQLSFNIGNVQTTSSVKLTLSVYGNDLRIKYPYKMGNVFSFLFFHGDPKIIIGPQCKFFN
jgi:hypothetical protein